MIEDKEVKSFFEFLISNKASNEYTSNLNKYVSDAKHNMQWRFQYMTWERMQTYAKNEGIAIGEQRGEQRGRQAKAIETAQTLLNMNVLTIEQIAQASGLSIEDVKELAEEINA